MKKNNIKHISELAGVSTTAVSFVLNNKPGVSEKTRKKVLEIIRQENFTPNVNSRRLILNRSFNIMVIVDPICSLDNMFYSTILQAVIVSAQALEYSVVVSTYEADFAASAVATAISQANVDGLIFLSDLSEEAHAYLRETGVPFVVVDSHRREPPYPCVRGDYYISARTAAQYLIANGHRDIAFMGYGNRPGFYAATFTGFSRAMQERGYKVRPEWIMPRPVDAETARESMLQLLAQKNLPTAVLCACDIFAIAGMNCAQQAGLRVPEDLSFCGIDDILFSRYTNPPLSTIHIDNHEMGLRAVALLNALITKSETVPILTIPSDQLIMRQSVLKRTL